MTDHSSPTAPATKAFSTVNPDDAPTTVRDWVRLATNRLADANLCFDNGLQEPFHEAEYLVAFALSLPFETLVVHAKQVVPPAMAKRLRSILAQRINQRLPVAYITQEAFFAGYRFMVDRRVLIPRSRIENLFDDEVGFASLLDPGRITRILDLGTGSGCLAIALAFEFPHAKIDAADVSGFALQVTKINVKAHNLEKRVRLVQSDLFANLGFESYDLIVTNPPYVAADTLATLPSEYQHEPRLALDGGPEGLDFIARILDQAMRVLTPGGTIICEVGDDTQEIMNARWPDFPGKWIYFHFGASGVFSLSRESLAQWTIQPFGIEKK